MAPALITGKPALELPLECRSCVLGMAMRTAKEAGLPESEQTEVVHQAAEWMSHPSPGSRSSLHLGRKVSDKVVEKTGLPRDFDIYREQKMMSNRLAGTHVAALRKAIIESRDPLSMAIRVAAAGNVIDFGVKDHSAIDIDDELRSVADQPFERFDLEAFRERLMRADTVLYICDNAGEIRFDTLLMETLRRVRPELSIRAAFRDAPILNDATVDDAHSVGMGDFAEVMSSGSRLGGSVLDDCSMDFRDRFRSSDLVLSKGQGNLSGLVDDADERVFFVFRTKCDPVARLSGTSRGHLQLIQGGAFRTRT